MHTLHRALGLEVFESTHVQPSQDLELVKQLLWPARDGVHVRFEYPAYLVDLLRLLVVQGTQPLEVLLLHHPEDR